LDDPIFKQDPDQYWQKYCVSKLPDGSPNPNFLTQKWNQYAADHLNQENFEPENEQTDQFSNMGSPYGTNGCLLIQTAVASAGGIFTDDVLSAEELAESSASSTGSSGGGSCQNQEPGQPKREHVAAISAYAPNRSKPGAVPNDPKKMYFGQYAYTNGEPAKCNGQTLGPKGGDKYGDKMCIGVKYRDPPVSSSNTEVIPVN